MVLLETNTLQDRVRLWQRTKLELGRCWKVIVGQNLLSFLRLFRVFLKGSDMSGNIYDI